MEVSSKKNFFFIFKFFSLFSYFLKVLLSIISREFSIAKLIRLVGIPDRRSRSLEDDRLIGRSRDKFLESSSIAKPKEFVDREDDFWRDRRSHKKNVSLTRKLKIDARDQKFVSVPRVGGVGYRWLRCAKVAPRLS